MIVKTFIKSYLDSLRINKKVRMTKSLLIWENKKIISQSFLSSQYQILRRITRIWFIEENFKIMITFQNDCEKCVTVWTSSSFFVSNWSSEIQKINRGLKTSNGDTSIQVALGRPYSCCYLGLFGSLGGAQLKKLNLQKRHSVLVDDLTALFAYSWRQNFQNASF